MTRHKSQICRLKPTNCITASLTSASALYLDSYAGLQLRDFNRSACWAAIAPLELHPRRLMTRPTASVADRRVISLTSTACPVCTCQDKVVDDHCQACDPMGVCFASAILIDNVLPGEDMKCMHSRWTPMIPSRCA
jgi:hypothetical protein